MWRESIHIEKYDQEKWNRLRKTVEIYELTLPSDYNSLPKGKTVEWKSPSHKEKWRENDGVIISEVADVWTNPRNTVKVAILGKDKEVILFSRSFTGQGYLGLQLKYSDDPPDIFSNLKKGTLVISNNGETYRGSKVLYFITNESIKNAKAILASLTKVSDLREKNNNFNYRGENIVKNYGTVTLQEVLSQEKKFLRIVREEKWKKRKRRWDLMNAVKGNLTFQKTSKILRVKAKALDGNTYSLECPIGEEEKQSWHSSSIYNIDYWIPFVFQSPSSAFMQQNQKRKVEILMRELFLPIIRKLEKSSLVMKVNRKKLKLERRISQNGTVRHYLNGIQVKQAELEGRMEDYLIGGKAIPVRVYKKGKTKALSEEAQALIEQGLNGTLRDLEGDLPFHLNVIYKEKEHKWFLEIAGKEYYIKGGYSSLSKVKSAISGNAILRDNEPGYDGRATNIIRGRIAELVGDRKALEILIQVKKMGALIKTISSSK